MIRPTRTRRRPGHLLCLTLGGALLVAGVCWLPGNTVPLAIPTPAEEVLSRRTDDPPPVPAPDREDLLAQAGPTPAGAPAPAADIRESFDRAASGTLPAGWSQWSNDTASTVGASATRPLSAPNALAVTGHTNAAVRVWLGTSVPADVQVSGAVYLDTLVPAQFLARGSGLNSATPNYYAVSVARGLEVQLVRVVNGSAVSLGTVKSANYLSQKWVRVTLSAAGNTLRAQVFRPDTSQYLNAAGQWQPAAAWALTVSDSRIPGAGQVGLGKGTGYAGTIYLDDFTATRPEVGGGPVPGGPAMPPPVVVAPAGPLPARPAIPRHYDHIRIAMLAYAGTPFGAFEEQLLRTSVDLVIPNTAFLERINQASPRTPQLIYTNTSSLYLDLLTDWLAYADRRGVSRELAFYHAARPLAFRGDSSSSRPVTWFWGVYRGGATLTNLTSSARSPTGRNVFGAAGESVYVGYPDPFREINLRLASGAADGWTPGLEYVAAVDATGNPTRWAPLAPLADGTNRLTQSGQIVFDPPADWKPSAGPTPERLFYVRFRTQTAGTPPVAITILGRDYVGAGGGITGTVPAFDAAADANRDGYLNDAEYARRAAGKNARFLYESRLYTEGYGQMRPATNPSSPVFRDWAVDFHGRYLARYPLAAGLFMDNAGGKPPVPADAALEPTANYANDTGLMLAAIWRAVAPRWVLANTGGVFNRADPVVAQSPAYLEEFGIRPMSHTWAFFEETAALVQRRAALATPAPLAVLDSHPQRGSIPDARMQLGVLAYYYLIADPDTTFLMFHGGFEPATSWTRHWSAAAAYNIGRPTGRWVMRTGGTDPANAALTYRVYQREYQNALVLFKPLSYTRGQTITSSLGDETATRHELGGTYRPLRADGTLGTPVTNVSLRNGEGAILIRGGP